MKLVTAGCIGVCLFLGTTVPQSAAGGKQAANGKAPRVDESGDPLPEGVFYRLGTTRLRHEKLSDLVFSTDGKQVLSQAATLGLRLWDVASGAVVGEIPQRQHYSGLVASPDGCFLAAHCGREVLLLNRDNGKQLASWMGARAWWSLRFSADSKTLVGVNKDRFVYRWDVVSGQEKSRQPLLDMHVEYEIRCDIACLSPDGTVLAAKPWYNGTMAWQFWDTATGKKCRPPLMTSKPNLHERYKNSRCLSPDNRLLAVVNGDTGLEVWDTFTSKKLPLGQNKGTLAVAFHPTEKLLALVGDGCVSLWDLAANKRLWQVDVLRGGSNMVRAEVLEFSPDGTNLAVGCDNAIAVLETSTGNKVGASRRDRGRVGSPSWTPVHFLSAGSFLLRCEDYTALCELATGKEIRSYPGDYVECIAPDGKLLVMNTPGSHVSRHLRVLDVVTGKELWHLPGNPWKSAVFADNGKTLMVPSGWEGTLFQFEASTGREIKRLEAVKPVKDERLTAALAVSIDRTKVASSSAHDDCIQLWELATGAKLQGWEHPPDWMVALMQFLPDGRRLLGYCVWGKGERNINGQPPPRRLNTCIWDIATGAMLFGVEEQFHALSADGRWLALVKDKTIQIWSTHSGRLQATVPRTTVSGFSPDGSVLAAVNDKHHLELWETATGRLVRQWHDPTVEFLKSSFAPDGRTLIAMCSDGVVLVCDVTGVATAPGALQGPMPQAAKAWNELGSAEGEGEGEGEGQRSHLALWTLVAGGDATVKILEKHLRPVELPAEVLGLVTDLDSNQFAVREKAMKKLEALARARGPLEAALANNPSEEMRARIMQILPKLPAEPLDAEGLRLLRAVTVLEQIGTSGARQLLEALAGGSPGARLTDAARSALTRIAKPAAAGTGARRSVSVP